jgi:hypothetical protein
MAGTRMVPQFDDTYWEDLKHTAQEVAGWPEWKKGEIGIATPTKNCMSRERETVQCEGGLQTKLESH